MKLSRLMIAAAVLLGLLLTSTVYAGGCCSGMAAGQPGFVPGDLSKEQQKQVADLRTEFLKKQEQLRSELGNKRIDLMELAQKDSPDEQSIEKKRQEIWSLQDAMRNEARTFDTKFRAILTPEQRQKLGPGTGMGSGGCAGPRVGSGAACPGCLGGTSRLSHIPHSL
jgi:Spy/CpxP family protein refolding chaperone